MVCVLHLLAFLVGCQSTLFDQKLSALSSGLAGRIRRVLWGYEGRLTHQDEFIDALEQVATVDELYQIVASDSVPMARFAAFIALLCEAS